MFQAAGPFDLHCLNKQNLLQRYESEEEDSSESEVGGHDNSFSPIEFQRVDSDPSDDDADSHERTDFSHLLPQCQSTDNDSRPVSMNTIKRRSDATFVAGSSIYSHEDDMIIELPSPENSPPFRSSTFLQPTVYVAPESRRSSKRQSYRSPSPASYLSDDESDIFVAEQVTYMEPETKPNLILISPTTAESSTTEEELTSTDAESSHEINRNLSVKREQSDHVSPLCQSTELFRRAVPSRRSPLSDWSGNDSTRIVQDSSHPIQRQKSLEHMGASATINCLSEVPMVPHPISSRSQSISVEKAPSFNSTAHSRLGSKSIRRPPSLRSMTSFTFPFMQSRPSTSHAEDLHARSMTCSHPMYSSDRLPSRNGRPISGTVPYCPSPAFKRDRSDSVYSSSNMSGNGSSLLARNHTIKYSAASSIYSTNSFLSNTPSDNSFDSELADTSFKQKVDHRKTLRRNKQLQPESTEKSTEKSFLGIRLGGKRKSAMKSLNF